MQDYSRNRISCKDCGILIKEYAKYVKENFWFKLYIYGNGNVCVYR